MLIVFDAHVVAATGAINFDVNYSQILMAIIKKNDVLIEVSKHLYVHLIHFVAIDKY